MAAGLLATAGIGGTVSAHNPRGGFPPVRPGTSAKPLPSAWAWPSHDPKPPVKPDQSPKPVQSPKPPATPAPSKSPHPAPTLSCLPPPSAGTTPVGNVDADEATAAMMLKGLDPGKGAAWVKLVSDWQKHYEAAWAQQFCSIDPLRALLDKQIAGKVKSLQDLIGQVGGSSGLSASDKTTIDNQLNSLTAGLQALKTKVDGETTLATLQADLATLNGQAPLYRSVSQWARLILGAEKTIAAGPDLIALESTIAGQIAAAPAGPETTEAQTYLDRMKQAVTDGEALAGPLPATLLAITPAQLASGAADATLAKANMDLFRAMWDLQLARLNAAGAQREIKEATATPKPTKTPAPVATPTPV
jgi:hypothetical protein